MRAFPIVLLSASIAALSSCAPKAVTSEITPPPPTETARSDSRNITESELASATQLNLLDYLRAERPTWLRQRAAGSRGNSQGVLVYVAESRLGTIETLRGISISTVRAVHYFDAAAAQAKFATRDANAVIQVITR